MLPNNRGAFMHTFRVLTFCCLLFNIPATMALDLIRSVAGTGVAGYSGDAGLATAALLNRPTGLGADASGNIYIADRYNHVIRKLTPEGIISTFAGSGSAGFNPESTIRGSEVLLNYPTAVAVNNRIFIADTGNQRIQVLDALGQRLTVWGNGSAGYSGDGAEASAAQFYYPQALVATSDNHLYVADSLNHVVRKISMVGEKAIITTIAGVGYAGYGGDGAHALNARLNLPNGLALDQNGALYIADQFNHRVRRVTPEGIIETYAGNGQKGYSGDGGAARTASLDTPYSLTFDNNGNLFISEIGTHRVRKVDAQGIINTVAGSGVAGFSGDEGSATEARLNYPSGVALGRNGGLYIADMNNQRLRFVDALGYTGSTDGHLLYISRPGNGSGTVTGPAGSDGTVLSCGIQCVAAYAPGRLITLRAQAASGSRFVAWGGACHGNSPDITLLMDASKTCSALFEYSNSIELSHSSYRVMENATTLSIGVIRTSFDANSPVSVAYHFEDDSAYRLMGDYSAEDGHLYWPSGVVGERHIIVTIGDNPHVNSDRRFKLILSNPSSGALLGTHNHATVTIVNDDILSGGTPCPLDAPINLTCNAIGVNLNNTHLITPEGHMTGGLLYGALDNRGWSSNLRIMPSGIVSGGILLGDVNSQGSGGDFLFHGVFFSGGYLYGTIDAGLGHFNNIILAADSVLKYGSISGSVRGHTLIVSTKARLEQVRIEDGTYLANVRLGNGIQHDPQTLHFGVGVENSGAARFNNLNPINLPECYDNAPTPLEVNSILPATTINPVQVINTMPLIKEVPGELVQHPSQAYLLMAIGGDHFAVHPWALAHSTRMSAEWEWNATTQQLVFHLGNGSRLLTHSALHAPCHLRNLFNLPLSVSPNGVVYIEVNEDMRYAALPDIVALPTHKAPGLWLEESRILPGMMRAVHVFISSDGTRRMQILHPTVQDLKSIERVVQRVRFLDDNALEFTLGNRTYRGIPDYVVSRARVPVPNNFRVQTSEDYNGDAIEDYLLSYPDGQQQILFALP
jgi:hypothetical protein